MRKIATKPVQFEWNEKIKLIAQRCWNTSFWYGDGTLATEKSVIVRESDWRLIMRVVRAAEALKVGGYHNRNWHEFDSALDALNAKVKP